MNKKKAIIISGTRDTGKTKTCELLWNKISDENNEGKKLYTSVNKASGTKRDFINIAEYKGEVYLISAGGDLEDMLKEVESVMKDTKYDIKYIFLTCRSRGKTRSKAEGIALKFVAEKKIETAQNIYTFYSNKIRQDKNDSQVEMQKNNFLKYIIDSSELPINI